MSQYAFFTFHFPEKTYWNHLKMFSVFFINLGQLLVEAKRILFDEMWLGEDNIVFYSIFTAISKFLKTANLYKTCRKYNNVFCESTGDTQLIANV